MNRPVSIVADKRESGIAMLMVVFLTILASGITFSSIQLFAARKTQQDTLVTRGGYALQFAHAGIAEATSWFRRQDAQPVLTFAPVLDEVSDPPVHETMDPEIGLVREFFVTGNLWGRYEVWKPTNPGDTPERALLRSALGIKDISRSVGEDTDGVVWMLRCRGIIYRRYDPSKAAGVAPNTIVATETVETEIRRTLSISLPATGALCVARGDTTTMGSNIRIEGGDVAAGVVYPVNTGDPTSTATITAAQPLATVPADKTSLPDVLGVTLVELEQVADYIVTDLSQLPTEVPEHAIVILENTGTTIVSSTNKLDGRFMLICTGSLQITTASMTNLSGLLFVEGDLTIDDGPSWIRGATIVRGTVSLGGTTDFSTITFDEGVLDDLRKQFGYRVSGPIHRVR